MSGQGSTTTPPPPPPGTFYPQVAPHAQPDSVTRARPQRPPVSSPAISTSASRLPPQPPVPRRRRRSWMPV
eukprot:11093526-Alexandrium_andersonii.AAC.1